MRFEILVIIKEPVYILQEYLNNYIIDKNGLSYNKVNYNYNIMSINESKNSKEKKVRKKEELIFLMNFANE